MCAAYAAEKVGLCFVEQLDGPTCDTEHDCAHRMQVWQGEMYEQIRALAGTGDPLWREMAAGLGD